MTAFLRARSGLLIIFIFSFITLVTLAIYTERTLDGDINKHFLAADMFGVPEALKEKGIVPLFHGARETGWDGQFYYYMANDLWARKDTARHIDAPSYRYQRIGMSLYAAVVSIVTFQDWVSPKTYIGSYFALVLLATWAGARMFRAKGVSPYLILVWSLGAGTQLTMFNALPDAAADAFLILGLACLFDRRTTMAIVPLTFSALSREVYVLFPMFIAAALFFGGVVAGRDSGKSWKDSALCGLHRRDVYLLMIPILLLVSWQAYVTYHFGKSPNSEAIGILGAPLAAWRQFFVQGLTLDHKVTGSSMWGYFEATCLVLFLGLLCISIWTAVRLLANGIWRDKPVLAGIAATSLLLSLLYACFGPTVAMHYTGYMKAAGVFAIVIPLMIGNLPGMRLTHRTAVAVLVSAFVVVGYYNYRVRFLPQRFDDSVVTRMSSVTETASQACLKDYKVRIELKGMSVHVNQGLIGVLFGRRNSAVITVSLRNDGPMPLGSTQGSGSVHMSYHWLDRSGAVVGDGERSAIAPALASGETTTAQVFTVLPKKSGNYILRLSPVQEGCAWFYNANPASALDLPFDVKG